MSEKWKCVIPINVTITDLEYDEGVVSFHFDVDEVGEQLGQFLVDAVRRAAEEALDES